jgi:ribosomal protein S18 acetylase RimI-like enzyme
MAARIQPAPITGEVVDLRQIAGAELDPLLEEESEWWQRNLRWDFRKSADLVRRFVDMRALSGCALVHRRAVVGYAYLVYEDHKALIGDLYVRHSARTPAAERMLLSALLEEAFSSPHIRRIEAQLMMMAAEPGGDLPGASHMCAFARNFMLLEGLQSFALPQGKAASSAHIERWTDPFQEQAAHVIAAAYATHVDSRINDQYRSVSGARRFLYNIVQYPGCGTFTKAASLAAFEPQSGRMLGICLSSLIGPQTGHITQICVAPTAKGAGVGYELLRRSLHALRDCGCRDASLTVTASNAEAVRLYERVGFRTKHRFLALAWEGF